MMKRYISVITLLLAACILPSACATSPATDVTLENKTWVMEKFGEPGNLQAPVPGTEITLKFDSVNANFSGSAGCNRYFGGYRIDSSKLTIVEPLGSTLMACPEPIMNQETQYLAILNKMESYKIAGVKLTITGGGKIIEYKPQ